MAAARRREQGKARRVAEPPERGRQAGFNHFQYPVLSRFSAETHFPSKFLNIIHMYFQVSLDIF